MKPLLAHVYSPHRVTYPCYVQPKLNGVRALYQDGAFQSRDEIPFTKGLLDHLAQPLKELFPPATILDGELYVHGWSLQRILGAITPNRKSEREDTALVEYHVFDVVDFTKTFSERKVGRCVHLPSWDKPPIRFVQHDIVYDEAEANRFYARVVADGFEGIMYRLGKCPYTIPNQPIRFPGEGPNRRARYLSDQDNRCWHLLKRKNWQDDEFFCVGVTSGEGKYSNTLGALRCVIDNMKYIQFRKEGVAYHDLTFNVSSGLTDSDRDHYWLNPPIGRKIKVKYLFLSDEGIPQNPQVMAVL